MDWELGVLAVFGFPAAVAIMAILFAAFLRYLKHQEWMAMIERGMVPQELEKKRYPFEWKAAEWKSSPSSAVTVTLIGVAITIGLATIGIGPWLIGGLIPTAIGCGLLIGQLLAEAKGKRKDQ